MRNIATISQVFPKTIGDVASIFEVSPSLLRHYELLGVVHPARDSIGRRLYLQPDIDRIRTYRAGLQKKATR